MTKMKNARKYTYSLLSDRSDTSMIFRDLDVLCGLQGKGNMSFLSKEMARGNLSFVSKEMTNSSGQLY